MRPSNPWFTLVVVPVASACGPEMFRLPGGGVAALHPQEPLINTAESITRRTEPPRKNERDASTSRPPHRA
jgi:hypothetical protein